jgi:hypothetical protein
LIELVEVQQIRAGSQANLVESTGPEKLPIVGSAHKS